MSIRRFTAVPPSQRRTRQTELDKKIVAFVNEAGPVRPVEIARKINKKTHWTSIRCITLSERGLIERVHPSGAPANGPGSVYYSPVTPA